MLSIHSEKGLTFAFQRRYSPVAYCAMNIKSGTRNEDPRFGGLAHFTEHLLFKGTETRSSTIVNSYIEQLGGELNAFTTKEETVIHATVLKEDLQKAIDLLTDISFRCIFPEKEIEKERAVIIEEIKSYKDSPSDQVFDDFEEMLFTGTPLSMPVLGKIPMLKKIDRNIVLDYYRKAFIPENMYLTISADFEEEEVLEMVRHSVEKYSADKNETERIITAHTPKDFMNILKMAEDAPEVLDIHPIFDKKVVKKGHQAHCVLGSTACSSYHPDRFALSLLTNIIGGPGANSRLNILLREESGLVYGADASVYTYADTGMMAIYFGCDKGNVSKCNDIIRNMLNEFCSKPMSEEELLSAKKQCLGQITIASDYGEAKILSMGKNLMTYGRDVTLKESRARLEAITAQDILRVANSIFAPERLSRLLYV